MLARSWLGRGVSLGRLGPVPIRLDPSLLVVLALLGWRPGVSLRDLLVWVVVAAFCILVHELGHAAAFVAFGRKPSVLLYGFGGVTSAEGGLGPWASLTTSLAGPLAGFALGAAVWFAGPPAQGTLLHVAWVDALFACFGFGVLNLLPIIPLDGGAAVSSLLRGVAGEAGERFARWTSVVFAVVFALIALRTGQLFAALLFFSFAAQGWSAIKQERQAPLRQEVRAAYDALLAGRPAEAAAQARRSLAGGLDPDLREVAAEIVVWSQLAVGDLAAARSALDLRRAPGDERPTPRLAEAAVALAEGAGEGALAVAAHALDQGEWAPPNVLVPLLERTGALAPLRVRLGPEGAALLERLVAGRG